MKTAEELYPEYYKDEQKDGYFYGPGSYQPIIEEFGNILVQVDDKDYSGDTRVLYEKEGKYGYLIFGWGSCSGCDALQACSVISEIQSLMDNFHSSIKWFDSIEEVKNYFKEKDWDLEFCWHAEETKEFINKVLEL